MRTESILQTYLSDVARKMGEPMAEETANAAATESATPNSTGEAGNHRPWVFSIIGLVLGVVALGLATIPGIAFEQPLPNPFAEKKKEQVRVERPPEREGGVTLKFRKLSVNIGGKVAKQERVAEAKPELEVTKDPVRWFTMSAIGCALVGLIVASIGQFRERHTVLAASSMTCCALAVTWQYFAIGIAIGAAVAAFLIVFAIFSSALN